MSLGKKTMEIENLVRQALSTGYLTPAMESEVSRLCEVSTELSLDEYVALDKLMGALSMGAVVAMPRKQFINVMEELVVSAVISRVAAIETTCDRLLDVGDIAAYALNRLPPLYATTEQGANFQRAKARQELEELIREQVEQAILVYLNRPDFYPERQALNQGTANNVFEQVSKLLQAHAPDYERQQLS